MRYFLMGDIGGGSDDFVDSITLFEVKDIEDLKRQALEELEEYYWEWVEKGVIRFLEINTLDQAKRHIDFFHKELNVEYDTDCWRRSVGLKMIEAKKRDVLRQSDFKMELGELK